MNITKLAAASFALLLSGWSLYEAGRSSRMLQRPEIRHRSAADELLQMSAQPEQAMVLWVPGELNDRQSDAAPVELEPLRKARSDGPIKTASSGPEKPPSLAAKQ